jgi:hypothetical protein
VVVVVEGVVVRIGVDMEVLVVGVVVVRVGPVQLVSVVLVVVVHLRMPNLVFHIQVVKVLVEVVALEASVVNEETVIHSLVLVEMEQPQVVFLALVLLQRIREEVEVGLVGEKVLHVPVVVLVVV